MELVVPVLTDEVRNELTRSADSECKSMRFVFISTLIRDAFTQKADKVNADLRERIFALNKQTTAVQRRACELDMELQSIPALERLTDAEVHACIKQIRNLASSIRDVVKTARVRTHF